MLLLEPTCEAFPYVNGAITIRNEIEKFKSQHNISPSSALPQLLPQLAYAESCAESLEQVVVMLAFNTLSWILFCDENVSYYKWFSAVSKNNNTNLTSSSSVTNDRLRSSSQLRAI